MVDYSPFAAIQIRIISGIVGPIIVILFMKRWDKFKEVAKNNDAAKYLLLGTLFGSFLGVSFSLFAFQYTTTGVFFTITSIIPVLIDSQSIFILKEKVSSNEILYSVISVIGVTILFVI
jgi:drug/metabolite transporter (DMT)-like permease